jgi:hypothetical protein
MNTPTATPAKVYIGKYKVVKIFRVSARHEVLEKNLTREEARRVVQSYPDSARSMVVFYKQNDTEKFYI